MTIDGESTAIATCSFPTRTSHGVSGFEVDNLGFAGFAGERTGFWQSVKHERDEILVLSKSAIDAMSYQKHFGTKNCRYLSAAGLLTSEQRSYLHRLFADLLPRLLVVAAVDGGEHGTALARQIHPIAQAHHLPFQRHSPEPDQGNDWNEVFQRDIDESLQHWLESAGLHLGPRPGEPAEPAPPCGDTPNQRVGHRSPKAPRPTLPRGGRQDKGANAPVVEDLEDLRTEIVGRLREAAFLAQEDRFDRAATALDALDDECILTPR